MRCFWQLLDLFLLITGLVFPPFSRLIKRPLPPPPPPSITSTSSCKKTRELFISFRGPDARFGFLGHLHNASKRYGIDAFVDEQLKRGEEMSKSLLQAIERSYISVVIFSEKYAFSPWCLDELVKIVECKETNGHTVIPVFLGVDPTHVQELTGSYGKALSQHRKHFDKSVVERWSRALMKASGVAGFHSCNFK